MRQIRWLLGVILFAGGALLLFSFVLGNPEPVVLDLPFVDRLRAPLWLALLGAFFAGGFAASAALLYQLARKSLTARRFEKRVAGLESEIHQLRNPPLAADDPLPVPEPGAQRPGK